MLFPAARDFKQNRVSLFSRLARCPPRLTRNFKFGQVLGVKTQLDAFEARMSPFGFFEAAVGDPFSAFSYNRGSVLTDFPIIKFDGFGGRWRLTLSILLDKGFSLNEI